MTVLFVVVTIALLLLLDAYLMRSRRRARALAPEPEGGAGEVAVPRGRDTWFHPAHVWVRPHQDGSVWVGASDFAANFAGAVESIDLPREGARLRDGDPAWTFVSSGGRRLRQPMPLDGEVVAVNRSLHEHPDLTQRSSYGEGWIARIRPHDLRRSLERLLSGERAARLMDRTLQTVNARLRPALGAVAQDGQQWAPAFGERLDDLQWELLRAELFSPTSRQLDPWPSGEGSPRCDRNS